MVHEKLKYYECPCCDKMRYQPDDEVMEELVKEYFEKSLDKRKGFNSFFKYIGINPWSDTYRGYFEYEGEFIEFTDKLIKKYQRLYRKQKVKNELFGNLFTESEKK